MNIPHGSFRPIIYWGAIFRDSYLIQLLRLRLDMEVFACEILTHIVCILLLVVTTSMSFVASGDY